MKSKLNYLTGISLKRKIKTKWFLFANILLATVIIGLINVDSIIKFFGGDFNNKTTIQVIDNTNKSFDVFKDQMDKNVSLLGEKESNYIIKKYEGTVDEGKKLIEKDNKNMIIVFDNNDSTIINAKIISKEYLDMMDTQTLTSAINNTKTALAIMNSNIPIEEINKIYSPLVIERIYLDEDKKSEDEQMQMIMTTVFPIIILPFFMLSLFLVQMIGAEVNDEKTTRGMEIIISNVSPKTHFFSKVLAGNLFVLIQGGLLFLFGALGIGIKMLFGGGNVANGVGSKIGEVIKNVLSTEIGANLIYIIPLVLILMVLTFVAYSLLAGILASMTTNIEDFQQVQTPIIIISLVGYYLSMMAGLFEGAIFIKIFAFVPLISAILAPSLLVLGQMSIIEFVIAILITVGTIFVLIKYGLKIYKVGILNYSSKNLWKKMFKAMKN